MATGIICEYNPFHNGHIYHLNKVKELAKNEEIILILSGNFTQRGNISIIEKYDKARLALDFVVDLVIELPFPFATESSDFFAKGALKLLNELKCNKLIFGSESNDIETLKELARIQLNNNYEKIVKEELDKGINYPTAMSNALKKITNKRIDTPNDLLGLSYVKEIIKNNYDIEAISIKRTNDYNDDNLTNTGIDSASSIRKALKEKKNIDKSVPSETKKYLVDYDEKEYFKLLKYKILSESNLNKFQTVDEGIDNKLKKEILNAKDLDDFINKIKSKRYTYNKISRMLTHIICSFTKEENKLNNEIKYIRVLGFSNKGRKYLNNIKKSVSIPIITNINKENIKLLDLELRVDNIYNLITNRNDNLYAKRPIN